MNTTPINPEHHIPGAGTVTWHVNQKQARHLIDQAIAAAPTGQPIRTPAARLIAATIHRGPGTALSRLASTGETDRLRALEELEHTSARDLPATWRTALEEFLRTEADQ
ncbi:hypothetical protein [Mycobacteroides abscessus]|uniref:hypothetical protein n=1 Tax=Mycobacteroides abscessus TaxID=36809 RepID=UPI00092A2596|nr:hypothetical protein [Mycobacteroides abscessus]SIM79007.1 Uncharacterised protein [Mycobacteroides abscessus subsp. abscessus]